MVRTRSLVPRTPSARDPRQTQERTMFKLCTVVGIYSAALLSVAAYAGVNLEYGQEYEQAYLETCEQGNSTRACTCSMEALEEKVGFQRFAEEVDRHRDDFLKRSDLATLATDLVVSCEIGMHASE
jgi:hypothetical protein